ncbi:35324_t:CDS:2, partial [Gigaspora margarita]
REQNNMNLSCIASLEAASIMNLTLDEKMGLLFNVNFPLEIPMGNFNDAWWPLTRLSGLCKTKIKVFWLVSSQKVKVERYKNSPDHTHPLEEIERIKHSKAIRTLVEQEAVKNYSPPAITVAVKEYATIELGLGSSARELKRKEVTNIKHKVRRTAESHLVGNSSLKIDFSNSVSYLIEQRYQVEDYRVPQRNTRGI